MFRSYRDMVRAPKQDNSSTPKIYNCNMCPKGGWHSENDVEIHKKEMHFLHMQECKAKHKERFCSICMTLQDSNEDLIEHVKTQHLLSSPKAKRVERKIYICNECTNIFFNKDILTTHMLYAHLVKKSERGQKSFSCPKCNKRCMLKSIWFHFQKHDMPSVSMCDICLVHFPSRAALYEHVDTHKGYFKCEPCGYNSSQLVSYNLHLQMHTKRKLPHSKVSSNVLSTVFTKHKNNFIRYNVHNTLKGVNLPKFMDICTLCREICINQLEAKRHILQDHMYRELEEKKKHLCVCGEEFCHKVVLKQHVMKTKGYHKPIEESSLQTSETLAKGKKPRIPRRNSLKSLLKYNKIMAAEHSPVEDHSNVVNAQNEGPVKPDEVKGSEVLRHNKDIERKDVNKGETNTPNKLTNQIIRHIEHTEGNDDNMAMAVLVASPLQENLPPS